MDSSTFRSNSHESSGSSSVRYVSNTGTRSPETSSPIIPSLRHPFENLESMFECPDFNFRSDTRIVVENNRKIPLHRRILSEGSPFFKKLFNCSVRKRSGWEFEMKELAKGFDVGFDSLVYVLGYMYCGSLKSLPKGVCICVDGECEHVGCRPAVRFMVEVLYVSFIFQIPELLSLYQRRLTEILDEVALDDVLVILSVANICINACGKLLTECIEIVSNSDIDILTLRKVLPSNIVKRIVKLCPELVSSGPGTKSFPNKLLKRIHKALDKNDVELAMKLVKKGHGNLDDAYALHYVVAYCDEKTTMELLGLGLADVNLRNPRGYTVLHVAAMRKEPKIIVSLLTKGAQPSDLTPDGRKALQISKRLTRSVDYNWSIEEGKGSPKDRLCIEVLEEAERTNSPSGGASVSRAMEGNDLHRELIFLEIRVLLAKMLFPMEAKVAMDIAQVDDTSEFTHIFKSSKSPRAKRTQLDMKGFHFTIKEEHLDRMKALSRTVELGKRYFPRCSEELNNIMAAEDIAELAQLEDNREVSLQKRKRYNEIQDLIIEAFNKDKEEFELSVMASRLRHHIFGPLGYKRKR